MNIERITEIAESLGWSVDYSEQNNRRGGIDKIAEFSQYSPAGEDFSFSVFYSDADELVYGIREAYADFDVNEHIEMWIDAKRNGFSGVPSAKTLVKDAEEIEKMLEVLFDKLEENATA